MRIKFSRRFEKDLDRLARSDLQLAKLIKKQLALFVNNPGYSSLRNHKLSGMNHLWSISINKSIRAIYLLEEGAAHFVDMGTHDEVYRK